MQKDNESQSLINKITTFADKKDQRDYQSSRFARATSSWTYCPHVLCWLWVNPLLSLGYKQSLTETDLDGIPHVDKSSVAFNRLSANDWTPTTTTSMIVIKEFWKEYLIAGWLFVPYTIVRVVQPLFLRRIILNIISEQKAGSQTYLCIVCLFTCAIMHTLLRAQNVFRSNRVGVRIRNALSLIIYQRALSMKLSTRQQIDTGHVTNLIINDAKRFEDASKYLHYLWQGPLETLIIFVLLSWILHPIPILCSYALFLLFAPLQWYLSRKFNQYREKTAFCTDRRVHAFHEFIYAGDIIKMYHWEKLMEDRIHHMRENELTSIKRTSRLRAVNISQFFTSTSLLSFVTFSTAWLLGYPLTTADIFTTLLFFALMRVNIMYWMPLSIENWSGAKSASKRIDSFMQLTTERERRSSLPVSLSYQQGNGNIVISNASFSWNDRKVSLSTINLKIKAGTLVGIVGPVGSGKSSLLAAILGEMNHIDGDLDTNNSSFSYAAQLPWIFSDTLRNNILLHRPFDSQRYQRVIHACCLDVDLRLFGPTGDLTVIGDKGVNLSGGQKTRVSLARALYADADIYLLDDPFASVDQKVATQIHERCVGPNGLLKDKTCLLVTHQTRFLPKADQIIFLRHGHIVEQDHLHQTVTERIDTNQTAVSVLADMLDENTLVSTNETQSIIAKEALVTGYQHWSLWYRLFTASPFGQFGLCLLIVLLLLGELLYDGTNCWLAYYLQTSQTDQTPSPNFAYIYAGLIVAIFVADILRTNYYFYIILHGSNRLHHQMLTGLVYTWTQFFESNPSGRILNRVSTDQQIVDEVLPLTLLEGIVTVLMVIGSTIIICFLTPYISLLIVMLTPLCWYIIRYYLRTCRQLKHLESITRSPVYSLLSSSLNGSSTIHAFNAQDYFIRLVTDQLDVHTSAYMYLQGATQWLSLRLDGICCVVILAVCLRVAIFANEMHPSVVAFSVVSGISLSLWLPHAVRQLIEAAILLTSVERIAEYAQLPREEDEDVRRRLVQTESNWPSKGTIEFRNYSLRHRTNLEYVIRDISLHIDSVQKTGIIGRTGAGKSSLFKGIFRLINQSNISGQILIDDVDISRVTLTQLRSSLSVIPQQPVLFSDSLRYNLDPFHHYTDEQCWVALENVQLKQFVSKHPSGLSMPIIESGANLSVGQCQLICIARALMKKSKILLIDEATANIDQKTDETIQEIFAKELQDRTVLIIAHRLSTVAKSDRVLVLDKGNIVNYDIPMNILHQYQ